MTVDPCGKEKCMGLLPCILDTCATYCYPNYICMVMWFGVKILQYTF